MEIIVREVAGKKELKVFYQFQNKLYKGCSQYVPSLDADQKSTLTEDPALEYCTRKMWLAYKGDRVVGRIQAIVNPRYNEFYNLKRVRFGWFDFEEDFNVAKALLDTAMAWGREQGMTQVHGPLFYNTLGKQGMLVEGFENTPPYNCLYNYPYYVDYMERMGFVKETDWIQFRLNGSQGAPEKLQRMADLLMKRYNLRLLDIRKIKGELKKELIAKFFAIYNECFKAVHNFIPLTQKEIEKTGNAYFSLLKPELTCMVVDQNNDIAAFGLCFPSLSEALKKANGSLFPFGWYHILKAYRKYDTIDLMMVGSNPAWAQRGLSAIYHQNLATNFKERNLKYCITNPQIDTNIAAIKVWESYDTEPFMRRRCWIRDL
jgi:hypothetical protein